jgi:hypothetical protein
MSRKEGKTKDRSDLTRRDFHKLSIAAFAGVTGGSLVVREVMAAGHSLLLKEPHVCCGLNTCKSHGAGGDNDCAGMGNCATAEKHGCDGQNKCKGQGGCGEKPGENGCNGQGKCAVPLSQKAWKNARANFEAAMNEAGRKFGAAPEGCPKG